MMEPGYGKWFQSAFCVFSLQYDMIDNLTILPFDLLRPTVAIVFGTLVRGPCLNGLPFTVTYLTLHNLGSRMHGAFFFLNLL